MTSKRLRASRKQEWTVLNKVQICDMTFMKNVSHRMGEGHMWQTTRLQFRQKKKEEEQQIGEGLRKLW